MRSDLSKRPLHETRLMLAAFAQTIRWHLTSAAHTKIGGFRRADRQQSPFEARDQLTGVPAG